MMARNKSLFYEVALILMLTFLFFGCGGAGGDGGESAADTSQKAQILPTEHDFGIVTLGNSPAPLEIKIKNLRSQDLEISKIVLSDTDNFDLNLNGGSNPCNTASPTIGVDDLCTAEISFQPQTAASFSASLQIEAYGTVRECLLRGVSEPIKTLNVRINQVESDSNCPAATITAYVSVTDQGGYPLTGLSKDDFTVVEDSNEVGITDTTFVSQVNEPVSIALAADFSGSITSIPELEQDIIDSLTNFVDQLQANDEAEIIKFGTEVDVVQEFTSNKNLLKDAISSPAGDLFAETKLFDAAWQAVDDTAIRQNTRKAVIVLTDGEDDDDKGGQASEETLETVINHANDMGVPIFTLGIGDANTTILESMANDTGGQFYEALGSDNLKNAYNQISKVLFEDQYILTYISTMGAGMTGNLTVEARTATGVTGDYTKEITPCP